jgi:hypothetical protein
LSVLMTCRRSYEYSVMVKMDKFFCGICLICVNLREKK